MGLSVLISACSAWALAAEPAESPIEWVVGARDADCETVCSGLDSECDEGSWPSSPQDWEAVASSTSGLLCLASAPGGWLHNPSICTEGGPAPGVCFWDGGGGPRCRGGMGQFPSTVARRICPCRRKEVKDDSAAAVMSLLNAAVLTSASKVGVKEPLKMPAEVQSLCPSWNGGCKAMPRWIDFLWASRHRARQRGTVVAKVQLRR
ncbi:unnamed protein product [Symbiodinium sp. CCMP2456]|nr:unnamed protein product [Symbiodinium sp. CCMP2456]